jgi:phosphoribosylformimino-5-aminoimidazole carboxamide ribotide isomerase
VQLIPAIDLRGGRCVRLYQGDFAAETRYPVAPAALCARYAAAGAAWLHVVDLDGAKAGAPAQLEAIASLARDARLKVQAGGGLRARGAVEQLLGAGVARAVIGSSALRAPALVAQWLAEFGPERIVVALDVRHDAAGRPCVAIDGWAEQSSLSLWDALARYAQTGLKHVLCTDVARDGALAGPSLALYAEAVRRHPAIEWQASGGVRDATDLGALAAAGVAAAVSGRALLEDRLDLAELSPYLPGA